MKIEIRSFVKGGNHGQFLQALGLKVAIKQILPDAIVTHADYENHFFSELLIQCKSFHLIKFISMSYYWRKYCLFSKPNNHNDITIYGSDMIWSDKLKLFGADPFFFGFEDLSTKKIAYAPSTGGTKISQFEWLHESLRTFTSVGVRDNQTKLFFKSQTNKPAQIVADPCFFLIGTNFIKPNTPTNQRKGIVAYANKCETIKNHLSALFGSSIYYTGYYPRRNTIKTLGMLQFSNPLNVLSDIGKSKLLITTTFHGVMMALMTKTPFIVIESPTVRARLESPINTLFSDKRILLEKDFFSLSKNDINDFYDDSDLDYQGLLNFTKKSRIWLENAINN